MAQNATQATRPSDVRKFSSNMMFALIALHFVSITSGFSYSSNHRNFNSYSVPQEIVASIATASSPTQLYAVSVLPRRGGDARSVGDDDTVSNRGGGWHKKVIKRVFRRDRQQLQAAATLMLDQPTTDSRSPIYFDYQESVVQNALSKTQSASATTGLPLIEIDQEQKPTPLKPQGTILTRTTRSVAENTLENLLTRWCNGNVENMQIACEPKSNIVDLARGLFRCDATVHCEAMKFPCLQFSGGRLSTQRLVLNLYSLKFNRGHRFPNQFDFEATDILFTVEDLFASDCIRNGLARLLTRVLRNRGMKASKVRMQSIQILNDGKLALKGHVETGLTDVAFEVRTGLSTASRGHVLTFPGLELSLSPALGLFIPVPEVSLDLGYSAQIHNLRVDPKTGLRISCQATVTPRHTLALLQSYAQSTKSYAAPFSVDVGRWLTSVGNFSA